MKYNKFIRINQLKLRDLHNQVQRMDLGHIFMFFVALRLTMLSTQKYI